MSQAITMRLQKPYCVVQAEERAKDFPKQERLNSMRRYIAEYDLFPAKSDPRNAPITMNELKALVRKCEESSRDSSTRRWSRALAASWRRRGRTRRASRQPFAPCRR